MSNIISINNCNIDVSKYQFKDGFWIRTYGKKITLFNETHKSCNRCGEIKDFSCFYEGLFLNIGGICTLCQSEEKKKSLSDNKKIININNYEININNYIIRGEFWIRKWGKQEILFNETHKQCSTCRKILPLDNFLKHKNQFLNINYECIKCSNNSGKEHSNSNAKYNENKLPLGYKTRNKNSFLQVRCYKCNEWMFVTNRLLYDRKRIENMLNHGECNLYCSSECKESCVTYNNYSGNLEFEAFQLGLNTDTYRLLKNQSKDFTVIRIAIDKVKERDNYTCQDCGSKNDLHGHHIKPVALCIGTEDEYLIYETSNIKTVCEECHYKIEHASELSVGKLKGHNKISKCLL